jgi:transcriptional antiterminator NusG
VRSAEITTPFEKYYGRLQVVTGHLKVERQSRGRAMAIGWYVVKSKPQFEKFAQDDLKKRFGVESFLPMASEKRVARGAIVRHYSPLFPTYLFINDDLGLNERWRKVISGRGVLRVLGGERPEMADEDAVSRLIKRCEKGGGFIDLDEEKEEIEEGFAKDEEVRVVSGMYTGFTGVVENHDLKRKRLRLFLGLFGRQISVNVGQEQVIHLSPAEEAISLVGRRSTAVFAHDRYDRAVRGRR